MRMIYDLRCLRWTFWGSIMLVAAWFVVDALPPRHLVIETGPVTGSYYRVAQDYAKHFAALGITLELRPRDDSLAIIADVNDPKSDVDMGFIAQAVSAAQYPNVSTVGSISHQPLFIFYRRTLGQLTRPTEMKGRRIELLAADSATSAAATALLTAYGVNEANATLVHHRLPDAVRALKAGQTDIAFFVLATDNPVIVDLMNDPDLELMSLSQSRAISQRLSFFEPLAIAHGSYDLLANKPPSDVDIVATTVDVIVKKNLPPSIVYTLMQIMMDLRSESSGLAKEHEFPAVRNAQLPVNQVAQLYYQNGMPWVNRQLPLDVASLADSFQLFLLPLVVLLPLATWFGMPRPRDAYSAVRMAIWARTLRAIERDVDAGRKLTRRQIANLQRIQSMVDPALTSKNLCAETAARVAEKHACNMSNGSVLATQEDRSIGTVLGRLIGFRTGSWDQTPDRTSIAASITLR